MIRADTRALRRYEKDLLQLNRRGLPYAVRNALNALAFEARKKWQREIGETFTLRNRFTTSSIKVEKARGGNIISMRSVVGSEADYMATQERGGTIYSRGSARSKPAPTTAARTGGSESRLVARPNRIKNIHLASRSGHTQRQRNAIQIQRAKAGKTKFALIEKGSKRGIFRVRGKRASKITLVQNLSHPSVRIRREPTMDPAVTKALPRGNRFYQRSLLQQLKLAKSWKR